MFVKLFITVSRSSASKSLPSLRETATFSLPVFHSHPSVYFMKPYFTSPLLSVLIASSFPITSIVIITVYHSTSPQKLPRSLPLSQSFLQSISSAPPQGLLLLPLSVSGTSSPPFSFSYVPPLLPSRHPCKSYLLPPPVNCWHPLGSPPVVAVQGMVIHEAQQRP